MTADTTAAGTAAAPRDWWVIAGMTCKIQVNTYDKKDALVVPKKAVHDDKDDPDQHYVWLVKPDDEEAKPERRNVKLGKSTKKVLAETVFGFDDSSSPDNIEIYIHRVRRKLEAGDARIITLRGLGYLLKDRNTP